MSFALRPPPVSFTMLWLMATLLLLVRAMLGLAHLVIRST